MDAIQKGNKLIDRFNDDMLVSRGFSSACLNYDSDYGTLMPVVDKIESMGLLVRIANPFPAQNLCEILHKDYTRLVFGLSASKKEAVWLAVVAFIEFWNAQNNG